MQTQYLFKFTLLALVMQVQLKDRDARFTNL